MCKKKKRNSSRFWRRRTQEGEKEGRRKEGGRSKKLNTLYSQKRALKAPSFFFPHFFFGVSRRGAALK